MQRYFLPDEQIHDGTAVLKGNDFHHVSHVMRMKPGDSLIINEASGNSWLGVVESFGEEEVRVRRIGPVPGGPALNVTVAQAMIKKDAFELMIQKATEFGVGGILPTLFSRSIVKIEDDQTALKKQERFQKIAKEASEQCHRATMPRIGLPVRLKDIPFSDFDRVWVCYEASGPDETLKEAVKKVSSEDHILILIGPEGGIEASELAFLKTQKAEVVDLGARILRSETASLYVLSVLSFLWER
jgi:16S rRNA (uracil1498-N3)-methyltransferase